MKAALVQLGILAQLPAGRIKAAAERLVELNLWENHGEYWQVHDFHKYGPPQRYLSHGQRGSSVAETTDERGSSHAPLPSPDPYPHQTLTRPVGSLENLRDRAMGRGVAAETITDRLAGLQQLAENKGAVHWIPYVLTGFQGQACLFDQHVSRWLEEDHDARGKAERESPVPLWLPDKRPA